MRKWEDIVRDKMEEPDGALPEGVFAEFQARLSGAAPAITRKHIRLLWVVATATAAALAAVLFIRQPEGTAGGIRIEKFPADPVAAIADSAIANEMVQSVRSFDRALSSNPAQRVPVRIREVLEVPEKDLAENSSPAVKDTLPPERQKPDPDDNPSVTTEISPFIPRNAGAGTVDVEVRPATGMIVGSGLLAAVVAPAFWLGKPAGNVQVIPNEEYGIGIDDQPLFVTSDRPDHCFPIRLGMSARIPVTDRLYVSTGLGYANYQSTFRFLSYGETKQAVHYLGVPLRMDWAFASGRWFDLYVGAGVMGD
ncbi:MAG: hypothetical protein IJ636_03960, partial [Bacteroidales bacterium]|nr:hypothetical protein [Bacteroidales bacterium]